MKVRRTADDVDLWTPSTIDRARAVAHLRGSRTYRDQQARDAAEVEAAAVVEALRRLAEHRELTASERAVLDVAGG